MLGGEASELLGDLLADLHQRRPAGAEAVVAEKLVLDAHALEVLGQRAPTASLARRLGRHGRTRAVLPGRFAVGVSGLVARLLVLIIGAVHRDDFGFLEQRELGLPGVALGGGAPLSTLEPGDDLLELVDQVALLPELALGGNEPTAQLVDVRGGGWCVHGRDVTATSALLSGVVFVRSDVRMAVRGAPACR